MDNWLSLIIILVYLVNLVFGIFLVIRPKTVIQLQISFYAHINWRIEPISFQKEIRNTRLMGWLLLIVFFFALILSLLKQTHLSP